MIVVGTERQHLCGEACPYGSGSSCFRLGPKFSFGDYKARETRPNGPEDFTKPPTWQRTESCQQTTRYAAALAGVVEAADRLDKVWNAGDGLGDTSKVVAAEAQLQRALGHLRSAHGKKLYAVNVGPGKPTDEG